MKGLDGRSPRIWTSQADWNRRTGILGTRTSVTRGARAPGCRQKSEGSRSTVPRMDKVGIAEDVAVRLEDRLESGADVQRCLGGGNARQRIGGLHGVEEVVAEPCHDRGAEEHRYGHPRRALVGARAGPDLDNASSGGRRIGELDARLPWRNEVRAGDGGLEQYLTVPVQHAYVDSCLESTSPAG